MKKIALTIAAVATLGLAACNGAETTEANTAEEEAKLNEAAAMLDEAPDDLGAAEANNVGNRH